MMSTFTDKNVLITGGAGGIGYLLGLHALEAGAHTVVLWDIDHQQLVRAKEKLSRYGNRLLTQKIDITNTEQLYKSAEKVLQQLTHIDILINNAGTVVGKRFADCSPEDISRTIDVNLEGALHCCRAFLPSMVKRQSGHIVNIASAAGLMPNPGMSVYAASKWGMVGWSESLRLELKQGNTGVKVTTVEPSYIDTGMFAGVKSPLFTPLLEPEDISQRIINAVKQNKIHLRAPFMVKLVPFLRGVLPANIFDFVAGQLFQVYRSMDTFKGRTPEST